MVKQVGRELGRGLLEHVGADLEAVSLPQHGGCRLEREKRTLHRLHPARLRAQRPPITAPATLPSSTSAGACIDEAGALCVPSLNHYRGCCSLVSGEVCAKEEQDSTDTPVAYRQSGTLVPRKRKYNPQFANDFELQDIVVIV